MTDSLSACVRDLLIEHIESVVPLVRTVTRAEAGRTRMRRVLIAQGALRYDRQDFPRATLITERGRQRLATALADWADALVRAGYSGVNPPSTIPEAVSRPTPPEPLPSWPFLADDRPAP